MKDVTLFARKAGTEQQDYLKIRLSDVVISSYEQSGSSGTGDAPVEQVSCSFTRIEMEYRPMNAGGSLGNPVKAGFDLKAKRPL
jgi:type VI secretion system secreted protein Hcp